MKKIFNNRKYIFEEFKELYIWIGGLTGTFFAFSGLELFFDDSIKQLAVAKYSTIFLAVVVMIVAIARILCKNEVEITLDNDKEIVIKYGNILKSHNNIIVIPVNTTFDTIVGENIISEKSIHGQFVKQVFDGNVSELDEKIEESLFNQKIDFNECSEKDYGKSKTYPVGSIADVEKNGKQYYLLALTTLNDKKAECDISDYYKALIDLLKYIHNKGNAEIASIPILGSGYARLNRTKQELLINMISVCRTFNEHCVSSLEIVIYKEDKELVNLSEIKRIFK